MLSDAVDIKLHDFDQFEIELNSSCTDYFTLYGDGSYLRLYQDFENFQLWIISDTSSQTYILPWQTQLIFSWPELTINFEFMEQITGDGTIFEKPLFNESEFYCNILGISAGTKPSPECLVYRCPEHQDERLAQVLLIPGVGIGFIFLIASVILITNRTNNSSINQSAHQCLYFLSRYLRRRQDAPPSYEVSQQHI